MRYLHRTCRHRSIGWEKTMHQHLLQAISDSTEQGLVFHRSQGYLILTSNSIGPRIGKTHGRLRGDIYGEVGGHRPSLQFLIRTQTYRPQTIGERDPGLFISEELRRADSAISKRVFSATGEINGAAIELAQTSRAGGHRSKRSRTDTNDERLTQANAEQEASSAMKRSPRPDAEMPLTPRMTPARSMSTTDAHLNAPGKQKIEVDNPLCTRCWSAGLECLCKKPSRETAAVAEAGPE